MSKTVTEAVEELVRATVHLTDEDMGRAWKWGDYDEEGLRFALLMTHHELRDLAARLAARREREPSEEQRILAQHHQAYRDLTGVLAGVRGEDLDRSPAEGEWTLRETLDHMLRADHNFLAVNLFALERHRSGKPDEPRAGEFNEFRVPYLLPKDAVEGSIEDIRNSFFASHRRFLTELANVADAELDSLAWFWENEPLPIRFRLHRFEEHFRQHTIQLDKTLAVVSPPTEARRLVRNIYNALADVESDETAAEDLRLAAANIISERARAIASAQASAPQR